ncbi:MAG: hypothetical protein ACKO9Q_08825, partial [Pirellula sp.]
MAKTIASGVGMTKVWLASQVEPPPHSCALNQRGRTRMLGGVGRVPGNGHPYPISPDLLVNSIEQVD